MDNHYSTRTNGGGQSHDDCTSSPIASKTSKSPEFHPLAGVDPLIDGASDDDLSIPTCLRREIATTEVTTPEAGGVNPNDALDEHTAVIRNLGKRVVDDVIEIGRRLTECRKIVGHGNWLPWLEREFGWSDRTALNFTQVYEMSVKSETISDLKLPLSVLYRLAAPQAEEARKEVTERAEAGEKIFQADVIEAITRRKASPPAALTTNPTEPESTSGVDAEASAEAQQGNLAGNSATEDDHNVGDGDDRHDDNHAGDRDDRPATKPRTRRSSEQIQKDRAGNAASLICTTISAALDAGLSDALVDCLLTKHTDDLVEIARHPKFNTIFNAIVAGVTAELGGNEPAPDRESEVRLIGLQSENEELRARIAKLEAALVPAPAVAAPPDLASIYARDQKTIPPSRSRA